MKNLGDFSVSFLADARGTELSSKRLPGFKVSLKNFEKNSKIFEDFATAKQSRRTDANFCTSSERYKYTEANGWGNASVENFGIFTRTISL